MGIVRHRKWFFLLSGLLLIGSIISLVIPPALRPGIEFTGGAAITVSYTENVTAARITEGLEGAGQPEAVVQSAGQNDAGGYEFFIRLGELTLDERDEQGNVVTPGDETRVREALAGIGTANVQTFDRVSGTIGAENVRNSIIAVIAASAAVLLYVTWAFRRVTSPFRYGATAVVALVHDAIIVLGLFSILGKTINLEVNSMFITGILLLIGYSVNDTIVIFDRVRENTAKFLGAPLDELVSLSIRETMGRSLNTSMSLLIVVVALMLFASQSIVPLLYVTAAGVIVGTYSSIFVACLLLVAWDKGEIGRLFRWLPGRRSRERATA